MSLDREIPRELLEPVTSAGQLAGYLAAGAKPASQWRIGTEHEKLGLYVDGFRPVPYEGERGIGALLERTAEVDAWKPVSEDGLVVGLQKEGMTLSLEPGGQLELSGRPLPTIHDTCREFTAHLALMNHVSEPFGIVWLGLGVHPLHRVDEIPRMPRARHAIMREYLPTRAELPLEMMHATGAVQVNIDYVDEADMVSKLRTALAITPVVAAIYANSSLAAGRPSGFISRRIHVWRHTDPDRTGLLPFAFEEGFGYRRYVEYALDVPVFFVVREGRHHALGRRTFRDLMRDGFQGGPPLLIDFQRHLTTLFPEVRLKSGVIELRCTDAVPRALTCSVPALWKGVLYDPEALRAAAELVRGLDAAGRDEALEAVARQGLAAQAGGHRVLDLARELTAISAEGLRRQARRGPSGEDERRFLEPVYEQLDLGRSPGRVVLERWEGDWSRSVERLIEYTRY